MCLAILGSALKGLNDFHNLLDQSEYLLNPCFPCVWEERVNEKVGELMKKLFEIVYILAHTSGTHTIFTLFAHISPSKFLKESKYKYKLYIYIYIYIYNICILYISYIYIYI